MADKPKPQADKFRELAKELETDDDEKAFEERVRRVASKPIDGPKNDKSPGG